MEKSKVEMFLMANGKFIPANQIMAVKESLEKLSDDKSVLLHTVQFKDPTTALLLAIFLGADRIYLGQIGLGVLKIILILLAIGLIWWLIDLFTVSNRVQSLNQTELYKVIG